MRPLKPESELPVRGAVRPLQVGVGHHVLRAGLGDEGVEKLPHPSEDAHAGQRSVSYPFVRAYADPVYDAVAGLGEGRHGDQVSCDRAGQVLRFAKDDGQGACLARNPLDEKAVTEARQSVAIAMRLGEEGRRVGPADAADAAITGINLTETPAMRQQPQADLLPR